MARPHSVTVFGASGFTGAWIAVALARALEPRASLVLAGRDPAKLAGVLARVRAEAPHAACSVSVLRADVSDRESLVAMARATRVVVNAAGPFRFLGEPVVTACIAGGAHYLDISGEPQFMEAMELHHHTAAAQAGVLVVSSCGFDSIPADVGAAHARETLAAAGATATVVDSFLTMTGGPRGIAAHYATFESAVHGFGAQDELRALRRRFNGVHPDVPPLPALPLVGPKPRRRDGLFWDERVRSYALPFVGADASVVRRTLRADVALGRLLGALPASPGAITSGGCGGGGGGGSGDGVGGGSRSTPADGQGALPLPFVYNAYMALPSAYAAGLFIAYGTVFQLLASFALGRRLLLAAPGLFSHGIFSHAGPSRAQIDGARFAMTFYTSGYSGAGLDVARAAAGAGAPPPPPDVHAVTRVSGPEPGYDATSRIVAACTLTLLAESSAMLDVAAGGCGPGVRAPGCAFERTALVGRLRAQGIAVDVVQPPTTTVCLPALPVGPF